MHESSVEVFNKCKSVFESCKTIDQVHVARKLHRLAIYNKKISNELSSSLYEIDDSITGKLIRESYYE